MKIKGSLTIIILGLICAGCNAKTRNKWLESQISLVTSTTINTTKKEIPQEPTEGRLVTGMFHAHPDLGYSARPAEPFASRGRWEPTSWGYLWIPTWLSLNQSLVQRVKDEIANAIPRKEADRMDAYESEKGPKPGTRIIIIDGRFSASVEDGYAHAEPVLYAGLYGKNLWIDFNDVIWVAWRDDSSVPSLVPALSHELWHQYSGQLTH